MGYAEVEYRRLYKDKVIVVVEPSSFKAVGGLLLPFHVVMKYFTAPGGSEIGTNFEVTVSSYDLNVNRTPPIGYPKGAVFVDTRTGEQFNVQRDRQVVTDAILAKAAALKSPNPDAPLVPRIRGFRAPSPQETPLATIVDRLAIVATAGLVTLVIYYGIRRLRHRTS